MRESSRIVAETLSILEKMVMPGLAAKDLEKTAEEYILSQNASAAFKGIRSDSKVPFPSAICCSINEEVVHGIPGGRILHEGDIVSIDVGVYKNGFYGDGAITIAVGRISEEKARLMKVTEEALRLGIERAVAKGHLQDISSAVQEHVEKNGFSVVRDLCGHGVGKKLHEDPSIPNYGKAGHGPKLRDGMTLAIEPMVNMGAFKVSVKRDGWTVVAADGKPSAHFEHTVLINGNNPEILTTCYNG